MYYLSNYSSPIGKIVLFSDDNFLIGLWFENQKYFASTLSYPFSNEENWIIKQAKKWLDLYFSNQKPNFNVPIKFIGSEFQKEVWTELLNINYGYTVSYGDIAKNISYKKKISPRAIGSAVGKNPISIIVPCHRVLGKNNKLNGYAGGLDRKKYLLQLENIPFNE